MSSSNHQCGDASSNTSTMTSSASPSAAAASSRADVATAQRFE